jgi:tRNA (guanine-N7-)-methyltransferase
VALERLFRPLSINSVVALFPTPWPREQQSKQRLFSNGFLKLLNSRLMARGQVQIVTDYERFAKWILKESADTGFEVSCNIIGPSFGTKFERKWLGTGQREFYELRLDKEVHQAESLKEDSSLFHYHVDRFDPEAFQPMGEKNAHWIIEFKDYLFDPRQRKGLVRVYVVEGSLIQSVWIEMVEEEARWRIRIPKGYGVVPTEGVRRALALVRDQAHG